MPSKPGLGLGGEDRRPHLRLILHAIDLRSHQLRTFFSGNRKVRGFPATCSNVRLVKRIVKKICCTFQRILRPEE